MKIFLENEAVQDRLYWQKHNPKILKKIDQLLKNCQENPYAGLGKPKPLKHEFSGYWSRRINDEHRLVYTVKNNKIFVVSCYSHYK